MVSRAAPAPVDARRHPAQPGRTARQDTWWIEPLITVVVLGVFVVYSTWAVFQGRNYYADPYLSPFYSPLLTLGWWPFSPAILLMWIPLSFRLTCYYYRKAYYRAFFWDPPACMVGEPHRGSYSGERGFPFNLQNLHRLALYASLLVLIFLWYDTVHAFFFRNGFGIGLGSLILLANVILLSGYTFSCHSFRHLVGGNMDCYSCVRGGAARHGLWGWVSGINAAHGRWAWASLVSVLVADLYVRLVASGVIQDVRFI